MRGLRKYLTPFAPDQSGAVSVLFELGGIVVICDAGGCTGNVCGFDEPRWFEQKSAIFSAGLRDMDAILGRDDRLVAKLADVVQKIDATFVAVIGTPVPAVIATDYLALKRMSEKKIKLPILTVDTDGMELYDKGEEKAFLELFKIFAIEKYQAEEDRIGILGMTRDRSTKFFCQFLTWCKKIIKSKVQADTFQCMCCTKCCLCIFICQCCLQLSKTRIIQKLKRKFLYKRFTHQSAQYFIKIRS